MAAGSDNLIVMSKEAQQQVWDVVVKAGKGGGGVNSDKAKKWRLGELEFEAWMRLLDNQVCIFFKNTPP